MPNEDSRLMKRLKETRNFSLLHSLSNQGVFERRKVIEDIISTTMTPCFESEEVKYFEGELLEYLELYSCALMDLGMSQLDYERETYRFAWSRYQTISVHLSTTSEVLKRLISDIVHWWFETPTLDEAMEIFDFLSDEADRLGFDDVMAREFRREEHDAIFTLVLHKLSAAMETLGKDRLWEKAPRLTQVISARWHRMIGPKAAIFLSRVLQSFEGEMSVAEEVTVIHTATQVYELGDLVRQAIEVLRGNRTTVSQFELGIGEVNLAGQYAVVQVTLEDSDPRFDDHLSLLSTVATLLRNEGDDLDCHRLRVSVVCGEHRAEGSVLPL